MKKALLILPLVSLCIIGAAPAPEQWVPGWDAPPIGYEPKIKEGLGRPFNNETVRQELYSTVTGRSIRVRLTNELSDTAMRIGAATIVRLDAAGKPIPGSLRTLTFSKAGQTRIPSYAAMLSDPLAFPVKAGERLAIAIYFPEEAAPPAHAQMVDVVAGNAADAIDFANPVRARASGIVSTLEVAGTLKKRVLVTFGDSITEGAGSSRAMSWPDQLGRLLSADPKAQCWAVANAGISGNRLLNSGRGPNGLSRFDRDVLSIPGATHLVILEGINDIGKVRNPNDWQPPAEDIIVAYEQLLARARSQGLKVIVGTLLPFKGAAYADGPAEQRRMAVNAWIRANRARFDGLIDFNAAMGEAGDPTTMRLTWQIGDHLHPNDAGYATMAKTALPVIRAQGCR
jgi:lysophospholipase L1-like esterase